MTAPVQQPVPFSVSYPLAPARPPYGVQKGQVAAPVSVRPVTGRLHGRGNVGLVSLRGELDFLGAGELRAHLSDIRQAWAHSVADLTALAFIDCACLSVLVRHCKEVRAHDGRFALAGPQSAVLRVLSITGLLGWFQVFDNVEDAVAGIGDGMAGIGDAVAGWRIRN